MVFDEELSPKEILYFQLRDEQPATESVEDCGRCAFYYQLSCTHLSAEDCETLKAKKMVTASKDKNSRDVVQVYECGHACRNQRRVTSSSNMERKYCKGMCTECLREWVWEGRAIRTGKIKGITRPCQYKKREKAAKRKSSYKPRGVYKAWVVRGLVFGKP